ncbi:hypothetical protein A9Q84_05700 [Halobacteriovorax marinus]|uniref:Uncharacterized protein n=1 Tax=Halobacteriovorax marinus TaxID=97084 RepID=A0A1Y5FBC5_9BACT|nr:hypothetical protein A9Q84_05700 [Halobacteriovorax marinus]
MINSNREIFIFFLKLSNQLPSYYFYMSEQFKAFGISLVPVTLSQLKEIRHNNREYIISLTSDFTKYRNHLQARKNYLDYMVLSRKFCLFDISSFEIPDMASKGFRSKSYHFFQLPVNLEETVKNIAIAIYEDRRTKLTWPGGVRSKLPSDVGSSS